MFLLVPTHLRKMVVVVVVVCKEIGWEERSRKGLFCVEWDVKP